MEMRPYEGLYESDPAMCDFDQATIWCLHAHLTGPLDDALRFLGDVMDFTRDGLTGEYVGGDSWTSRGEPPVDENDLALHIYYRAVVIDSAYRRARTLRDLLVENGSIDPHVYVSTAGDWDVQLPDQLGQLDPMPPKYVEVGSVRVWFDALGEGRSGDYDPKDPDDESLLRLDCNVKEGMGYDGEPTTPGWLYPDQGSICTQVADNGNEELERALLGYAGAVLDHGVRHGQVSVKRMMDWLSWLPDIPAVESHRAGLFDPPVVQGG